MGLTWGEARKVAKAQDIWHRIVAAKWLTRGEEFEDEWMNSCDKRVDQAREAVTYVDIVPDTKAFY